LKHRPEIDLNVSYLKYAKLPKSDNPLDDHSRKVDESQENPDARRMPEQKFRKCLVCHSEFLSAWAGERICKRCKGTPAWRNETIS
jgi:hypothetical protein